MEPGAPTLLHGRSQECARLDALLSDLRDGQSGCLILRGEAGIGKTALLEYLAESARDLTVLRAAGVQSEMEVCYAGLHQLLAPLLDRLGRLAGPQRQALEVVFGLGEGTAPDQLLLGLGVLSLLSDAAEERPLLCIVDDAQWLDHASVWTVAFVARRLQAEALGLVLAARDQEGELEHWPELRVNGLRQVDARALLGATVKVALDEQICDRIVAETAGNPLALIELPRGSTVSELAGGFGLFGGKDMPERISESFLRRLDGLCDDARRLVLLAAAEPVGDPLLLWRAAGQLGIASSAADDAAAQGLLAVADRVTFRHPLVRSAAYQSATVEDRRVVHRALAEATDGNTDPDRRAWHLAASATGPDELIALELERSAARAQARGGLIAAASFLERAVALTAEPAKRADRALVAAEASMQAGALDVARRLLVIAEMGPLEELGRARVDLLHGHIALLSTHGSDAVPLLLRAAKRLEPVDASLARDAYLDAWGAALFSGRLSTGDALPEVSQAALSASLPDGDPRPADLLLDALATLITDGRTPAAAALLQKANTMFTQGPLALDASLRWGWLTVVPSYALWDEDSTHTICVRQIDALREAGALGRLSLDLATLDLLAVRCGDFASADAAIAEISAISEATGTNLTALSAVRVAAFRGRESDARPLIDAVRKEALALGQGVIVDVSDWILAVLCNGLGHYGEALAAVRGSAGERSADPFVSTWAAIELLEAATREHEQELAERALARIVAATEFAGTESALGVLARCRALLAEGETADSLYEEAIERLARTRLRPELARAHLLFGEWLRRQNRRVDARSQLRAAHEHFTAIGMEAFAERARRELLATGETVRQRTPETRDELTAQEAQIARLACDGLSNPEIGTRLFISPRTVKYHLRKVFIKLDISSRSQLASVMPSEPSAVRSI